MKKIFKSKKTKKIVSWVLAGVLLVGAIFGVTALFRKAEEKTKSISPTYAVGAISENGSYKEQTNSIYTKDVFACQGLKTTPTFESDITYSLHFYNYDKNYVYSENDLTGKFNKKLPLDIAYARISIETNDDEVKWYEISKYSSQLDIQVNKNQLSLKQRIINGETYFDTNKYAVEFTSLGEGYFQYGNDFVESDNSGLSCYTVDSTVKNRNVFVVAFDSTVVTEENYNIISCQIFNSSGEVLKQDSEGFVINLTVTDEYSYVYYDVSSLGDVQKFALSTHAVSDLQVYAIYAL